MPRITYDQQQREIAFRAWLAAGQNISETQRILEREQNWPVARPTLTEWALRYEWRDRAARLEIQERQLEEQRLLGKQRILTQLLRHQARYDEYFDSLPAATVDTTATLAYGNLAKLILGLQRELDERTAGAGASELGDGLAGLLES